MILTAIPFLGIFSFPLTPMLYALGRSDGPLKAKIYRQRDLLRHHRALSWALGIVGAAIALVLANAVNVAVMVVQLWGEHRRVRAR